MLAEVVCGFGVFGRDSAECLGCKVVIEGGVVKVVGVHFVLSMVCMSVRAVEARPVSVFSANR